MKIIYAESELQIGQIRILFREYQQYLNVDLCFQSFEEELAALPGKYAPPTGALLLAVENESSVGCVALRSLESGVCEMKRLFVRPQYRGNNYGKILAEAIIKEAEEKGYASMRLDTLEKLKPAIKLYEALGFKRIEPYYHNPLGDAVYMELNLQSREVNEFR